jgi:hypothetical protein
MNQTVTVVAVSTSQTYNDYGDRQYVATTATYKARVVRKQHVTVDGQGREVVSRGIAYLGETSTGGLPNMGPQDKITLDDNSTPPVLSIDTIPDDSGNTHHQAVHFG